MSTVTTTSVQSSCTARKGLLLALLFAAAGCAEEPFVQTGDRGAGSTTGDAPAAATGSTGTSSTTSGPTATTGSSPSTSGERGDTTGGDGTSGGATTGDTDASSSTGKPSKDAGVDADAGDSALPDDDAFSGRDAAVDDAASDAGLDPAGPIDAPCLADIDGYFEPGPFGFEAVTSDRINLWLPDVPAGCKVPMVHMGNGTGASCSSYIVILEGLAAHGFAALCYEDVNTGGGGRGLEAFETALAEYPDRVATGFGSMGHGAGGQGAFMAATRSEEKWGRDGIYAILAVQPESGFGAQPDSGTWQEAYARIRSPAFMFSGNPTDGLVSRRWVQEGFDALNDGTEAYHWTKTELHHIPVPQELSLRLAVPWFRWKLLGDERACEALKAIPGMDPTWEVAAVQNEAPCTPPANP